MMIGSTRTLVGDGMVGSNEPLNPVIFNNYLSVKVGDGMSTTEKIR